MQEKKENRTNNKNPFEGFSFITGAVRLKDLGYAVLSNDSLAEQKVPHSQLIVWDNGEWSSLGMKNWATHAITVATKPLAQMVVVSEWGQVFVFGSGDMGHEELINDGDISPKERGPLRRAANIEGLVYACGMNYQVYKRSEANQWKCIDESIPKKKEVTGFEAIAGNSEDSIYAVGWGGEIWHYDGKIWNQEKSPTNLILTGVTIAPNGIVYACGQRGLILKRENNEWKIIAEKNNPKFDLWDIKWFKGKLYTSGMSWLFLYDEKNDNLVPPEDFSGENPQTFYHLSVADGILWSIGSKDIVSFDGEKWQRI